MPRTRNTRNNNNHRQRSAPVNVPEPTGFPLPRFIGLRQAVNYDHPPHPLVSSEPDGTLSDRIGWVILHPSLHDFVRTRTAHIPRAELYIEFYRTLARIAQGHAEVKKYIERSAAPSCEKRRAWLVSDAAFNELVQLATQLMDQTMANGEYARALRDLLPYRNQHVQQRNHQPMPSPTRVDMNDGPIQYHDGPTIHEEQREQHTMFMQLGHRAVNPGVNMDIDEGNKENVGPENSLEPAPLAPPTSTNETPIMSLADLIAAYRPTTPVYNHNPAPESPNDFPPPTPSPVIGVHNGVEGREPLSSHLQRMRQDIAHIPTTAPEDVINNSRAANILERWIRAMEDDSSDESTTSSSPSSNDTLDWEAYLTHRALHNSDSSDSMPSLINHVENDNLVSNSSPLLATNLENSSSSVVEEPPLSTISEELPSYPEATQGTQPPFVLQAIEETTRAKTLYNFFKIEDSWFITTGPRPWCIVRLCTNGDYILVHMNEFPVAWYELVVLEKLRTAFPGLDDVPYEQMCCRVEDIMARFLNVKASYISTGNKTILHVPYHDVINMPIQERLKWISSRETETLDAVIDHALSIISTDFQSPRWHTHTTLLFAVPDAAETLYQLAVDLDNYHIGFLATGINNPWSTLRAHRLDNAWIIRNSLGEVVVLEVGRKALDDLIYHVNPLLEHVPAQRLTTLNFLDNLPVEDQLFDETVKLIKLTRELQMLEWLYEHELLPETSVPPADFDITVWNIGMEDSNGRDDLRGEGGGNVTIGPFLNVPAE